MASDRWGSGGAGGDDWDDERWAAIEATFVSDASLGSPDEDLAHELALAAALDASRTDLNPDPAAAERMSRFLDRLGREREVPAELSTEQTTRIERIREPLRAADTDLGETRDLTADLAASSTASSTAAPTESLESLESLESTGAGQPGRPQSVGQVTERADNVVSLGNRRSRRRNSHVLPANHPDNARRPKLGRRVALVGAAAAAGLVALVGGTAAMSGDALPGDSLYAMKLMSESTGTAFTFGDAEKARRHLDIAATRIQEIERLQQAGRTPDPATYESALRAFDAAASEGSRMVLAGPEPSDAGLDELNAWAHRQSEAIAALESADGEVPGAADSARLMERLAERSAALQARMGCSEVSSGADDLGPVPATSPCVPVSSGSRSGTSDLAGSPESATRSGGTTSTGPSGTTTTSPSGSVAPSETEDGLLGGVVGTDQDPTTSSTEGSSSTSASGAPQSSSTDKPSRSSGSGGGGGLLPPINLPPLLPGLPSITLG
ncbi:DUF5667 domain-containing protein [Pseudonocardia xishanensis]|uniref:DUF5667 domain-containing protein n=1 Tax=Pseudonocardia xishanensis TaxID=630995 RepID=A0ABP8S1U4_9PSEU